MLHQLALNSNTYHGYSLEEAIKGASEAGFKQIEISAVKDHTSHISPDMTKNQLEQFKQMLKEHDLTCVGISGHSNVMKKEGIDQLLKNIDLTNFFDCRYIVTATGDSHDDSDVIDDINILLENLQPVLEKCEKLNKTLVIETHGNNFATGEAVKKLAQQCGDRLKVNYDTGNIIFYGDIEPYDDLEASLDYVEFIHLKDKRGANNEWDFPAIGDGDIDFPRLFQILKSGHYKGPISVEIEFTKEGPANLDEVNTAVKRSYRYLSNLLKDSERSSL